jgi:hypothetical protein
MGEISATVSQSMSFDFKEMLRSKQALRRRLATAPITEKLRMLDELRERAITIRNATPQNTNIVREEQRHYKPKERQR